MIQFLTLLFAFWAISTKNPMYAIINLMGAFIGSAFFLWSIHLEFFSVILLIIYVTGVSILFLFVVMTLNLNSSRRPSRMDTILSWKTRFRLNLFLTACFFLLFSFSSHGLLSTGNVPETIYESWPSANDWLQLENVARISCYWGSEEPNSLKLLGQVLFTKYFLLVFLAGYVLFLAMVGSILLLKNFYVERSSQSLNRSAMYSTVDYQANSLRSRLKAATFTGEAK